MSQGLSLIIAGSEWARCEDARSSMICMGRLHIVETVISFFPVEHLPVVTQATSVARQLRFCYTSIASVSEEQRVSNGRDT